MVLRVREGSGGGKEEGKISNLCPTKLVFRREKACFRDSPYGGLPNRKILHLSASEGSCERERVRLRLLPKEERKVSSSREEGDVARHDSPLDLFKLSRRSHSQSRSSLS